MTRQQPMPWWAAIAAPDPEMDEGPPGTNGQALKVQNAADSADCADHHQPEQLDEAAAEAKRLATLRARLALAGWELVTLPNGAHLASRWGHVRHCTSLDAVEAFAQQVGVRV